jgi:hypothetical protein
MATLTTEQRRAIWEKIMRTSDNCGGITKAQLREVVDALDDWWEATGALSANGAIPQPQRGTLTSKQKARLFVALLETRYEVA